MRDRRRFIAVSLLACVFGIAAAPATAQAGPLLDWLFQRNRSQGLSRTTAGYPNTSGRTGLGGCLTKSCLFGHGKGGLASSRTNAANNLAGLQNSNATTAGFAPQGSCGPGWCQQTVVRYTPQIAYRTAYQAVPVTTYKTSTTINPENGLPRTCTRPCTSYSYQARRVPYTTYRPVYTTVPVADTFGQTTAGFAQQQPPAASVAPSLTPRTGGFTVPPSHAYQQPTTGGCASCQNGAANYPGYTPGNAGFLPPDPRTSPWNARGRSGVGSNPPGATPWQRAGSDSGSSTRDATPWQSGNSGAAAPAFGSSTRGGSEATPWQGIPDDGYISPPRGSSGGAADSAPSLRPEYPERYSSQDSERYAPTGRLKPVPMPNSIKRQLRNRPDESSSQSDKRIDDNAASQTRNDGHGHRQNYAAASDRLFSPNRSADIDYRRRPPLEPPSNQDAFDSNETRSHLRFDPRALRDVDSERHQHDSKSWPDLNDKTADRGSSQRSRLRGTKPLHEDDPPTASRFAAIPIEWPEQDRRESKPPLQPRRRSSGWRPVR